VLDPDQVADTVLGEEVAADWLSVDEANKPATVSTYRTAVIRALAALAAAGAVDDGGDFPATVVLTPIEDSVRCEDEVVAGAACVIKRLAASQPGRYRVSDLHEQLTSQVDGYPAVAVDVAGTWALLATLHDMGVVDVSQVGNVRTLISVHLLDHAGRLPEDFGARMSSHRARLTTELAALRDWYNEPTQCANAGFAAYFGSNDAHAPTGTCSTAICRCSSCWATSDDTTPTPALLNALNTPRPRPSARRDGAPYHAAVDRYVRALLWDNYRGLTAGMLHRVLRGDETYLSNRVGRRRLLWPRLLYHRLRGVDPGIKLSHVEDALTRLEGKNEVIHTLDGRVWRLRRHVEWDRAKAARAAAQPTTVVHA
jgi:hypothetical protein